MPALNPDFLAQLHGNYSEFPTFIETGTFYGNTIFRMEPYFKTLYTVEIKEEFYRSAQARYPGNKINFLLGDSSVVFEKLLPTISEKAIFFLDGHWSADDTGRGKKDCPLIEEITLINNLFKNDAILIIDDYRLFGMGPNKKNEICNWEDINKKDIVDILHNRLSDVYHLESELSKDDRLIIHINKI
jgi:hypothetical protein